MAGLVFDALLARPRASARAGLTAATVAVFTLPPVGLASLRTERDFYAA